MRAMKPRLRKTGTSNLLAVSEKDDMSDCEDAAENEEKHVPIPRVRESIRVDNIPLIMIQK